MTLAEVLRLRALGLHVIPLLPGGPKGKEPDYRVLPQGWTPYQTRPATDAELVAWFGGHENRNAGIVLGMSGLVVVETDTPMAEAIVREVPKLQTPMMTASARGLHRYFRERSPLELVCRIPSSFTVKGVTVELKRRNQYVLAPGSVHPNGHVYYEAPPWPDSLNALPELPLDEILVHSERVYGGSNKRFQLPETLTAGDRHAGLRDLMRSMQARGVPLEGALLACRWENANRCKPALDWKLSGLEAYLRRVWHMADRPDFERHPQEGWELAGSLLEVGMSVDAILIAVRSVTPDFDPEAVA